MQIHTTKIIINKKAKGVSLVEMLLVLTISAMILPAVTKLFVIALRDIPTAQKLIMTNSDKNNALYNLQQDVESAHQILTSFAQYKTDPNNLLIKNNDNTVTLYHLEKDSIDKIILSENTSQSIDKRPLPNARISFSPLTKNNQIYAIEVSSYFEQKLSGRTDKKIQTKNLYFVNSMQKELYK